MKSYTDLKQSKKLAEFLPLESADMYYQYVLPKSDKIKHNPEIGNPVNALKWYNKGYATFGKEPITSDEYCVPCWSLAALLEVLDDEITKDNEETLKLHIEKEGLQYYLYYENLDTGNMFELETEMYDDLVDCCVEKIDKLYKQNLK